MSRIAHIDALQLHDSRGNPTLEVQLTLDSGITASSLIPSGASKGKFEALELRDGDPARYRGKGVLKAVQNVEQLIAPHMIGQDPSKQVEIDAVLREIDGTENLSRLGSNAVLGVSLACARAAAADARQPLFRYLNPDGPYELPVPQVSIIGGGLLADNPLEFQDFLAVPIGAQSFSEAVYMGWNVRRATGDIIREMGHPLLLGDGGGFAPGLKSNRLALELVLRGIEKCDYHPGQDVAIAMDIAASHFNKDDHYTVDSVPITSQQMVELLEGWCHRYPLISIEDPLGEEDVEGWQDLTIRVGKSVQLVGDDLFVTNPERLTWGIEKKLGNSILIKLNQIGTLTDTTRVLQLAQKSDYGTVVSIRSGETEDTFISDFAVATKAGQIKLGSIARSSKVAKFNQLLRIEKMLGPTAIYAGRDSLKHLATVG